LSITVNKEKIENEVARRKETQALLPGEASEPAKEATLAVKPRRVQ